MNSYHLVEESPWPIVGSLGAFVLTSGLTAWFHGYGIHMVVLGLFIVVFTMFQWWRDVIRESSFQGFHTESTTRGLKYGMVLFIVSEVCFFFAFFWAFFWGSLGYSVEIGAWWVPKGINHLDYSGVPLLNTAVLVCSGMTVTWCHHALCAGNKNEAVISMVFTIILGLYFTMLQAAEYIETSFTMSDSILGTTFYVATGFHGLHVMIGTTFLIVNLFRIYYMHYSVSHHVGFEAAVWYWHFVDVVWLFLYVTIYYWSSVDWFTYND